METPNEVIKHEKRKGLIMLGIISLGLLVFGTGFYFAGIQLNDTLSKQGGVVMTLMGVTGGLFYIWSRKHPLKSSSK